MFFKHFTANKKKTNQYPFTKLLGKGLYLQHCKNAIPILYYNLQQISLLENFKAHKLDFL